MDFIGPTTIMKDPRLAESGALESTLEIIACLKNYNKWILDEIRPFLGHHLAEVGGGIGTFTELLVSDLLHTDNSYRLKVFEPAAGLYEQLSRRMTGNHADLGRLIITKGYFEPCSSEQFDTVIMINVLEHIEDDLEELHIAYRSLCPGGALIIFAPALSWLYSAFDKTHGHYRRYEKASLENLFSMAGFEVVKSSYMDCLGVVPWYLLNVLGGFQAVSPSLIQLYDKWFVPATRWIESLRPAFVGKNILMVGKKK